jgi:hypothetical protein
MLETGHMRHTGCKTDMHPRARKHRDMHGRESHADDTPCRDTQDNAALEHEGSSDANRCCAVPPASKYCRGCCCTKPRSEFYHREKSSDKLQSKCKACHVEYKRTARHAPKSTRRKKYTSVSAALLTPAELDVLFAFGFRICSVCGTWKHCCGEVASEDPVVCTACRQSTLDATQCV